ncbi:tail fiber domain-containing protein [Aureibaculum sp. A20]|uniref:Tail fiber domain-containing protein n=1 Tax=Aureibaculum flavum TaxID=2795986 RepID=A0ABS0WMM1_9FLAO|nr:tail fiber domain-containing protein [Aureibaculum flavum]MBJ2173213.1 tail fiber domain-containing protein [Aureibaculum flavum]
MKQKLQLLILFLSLGIYTTSFSQGYSGYVNYQGVASNASGEVMAEETITVGIGLRHVIDVGDDYSENHTVTTDTNGVFSLKIGSGTATEGRYYDFEWSNIGVELTVSINGTEIGTTEMQAVPYALSSGYQSHWRDIGTDEFIMIEDDAYRVIISNKLLVEGDMRLQSGAAVNEISTDGTLAGNSDEAIPTEKAIKTYVDNNKGASSINELIDAKSDNDGTDNGSSVFIGVDAGLNDNGTANANVGIGYQALYSNTTGSVNTAIGFKTLYSNITGSYNTANGVFALNKNTSGSQNSANGREALFKNTTGNSNTANGYQSLYENTTGNYNTAIGLSSLKKNKIGYYNTAIGRHALQNTTASYNVAVGNDALNDLTTGSNNIGIGADSQVPSATASHQVRIGNSQITYAGVQVAWTITSDAAWKDDIQPLQYGLDMVTQLKPVDYVRQNNEAKTREIGFVAQDVELLLNKLGYTNTGILTKDDEGRLSLRYNDFIPLLTKSVQELNDKTNALETLYKDLLKRVEVLEKI